MVTRRCKEALVWDMTGLNCSWGSSVKEGGGRESITRHKLHRRTHYLIPMQNWSQADRVADHSKQIIRPKGTKKEGCDHAFSLQKKFCSDIITSTIQTYSNQTKSNQVSMRTVCVVLYIYIRVCVCVHPGPRMFKRYFCLMFTTSSSGALVSGQAKKLPVLH